jgi:hypothetical protein
MARKPISSTDLIWIFHEKLEAFDDCPEGASIAVGFLCRLDGRYGREKPNPEPYLRKAR